MTVLYPPSISKYLPCFGGARIHHGSPIDEWKGGCRCGQQTKRLWPSFLVNENSIIFWFSVSSDLLYFGSIGRRIRPGLTQVISFSLDPMSRRIRPGLVSWRRGKTTRLFCFRLFPPWQVITLCLPTTASPSSHGAYLGFSPFLCVLFFNWSHLLNICVQFVPYFLGALFKQIRTLSKTNHKKWHCFCPVNLLWHLQYRRKQLEDWRI